MPSQIQPSSPLGLVDSAELARRLGVSKATIRSWRNRDAAWLPEPVGRLDGYVWREEDLVGIEDAIPDGPGRPAAPLANRLADAAHRRARGVYYTPRDAAHFIASWALRGPGETFLEPSFGDGSFISAVADVAAARGLNRPIWVAGELDSDVARNAVQAGLLTDREVRHGDFLAVTPEPVDAIIANPPYVRLRYLPPASRALALQRAAAALDHPMHPSGSVWMPFVAHMMAFLKDGGRAGLVLPLDFTYVAYARPLWGYLSRNFGSLRVIRTRQRVFSDINQDVMVLLADEFGGRTAHVDYEAFETADDLVRGVPPLGGRIAVSRIISGERVFQTALLPDGLAELMDELSPQLQVASDRVTFRIGYIAGNKTYFHPTAEVIKKYSLPQENLSTALINSRRLKGRGLRTSEMDEAAADLLWVPGESLSAGEKRYIRQGEAEGVAGGYKAQMRKPWYRVPGVRAPEIILSVFSERPLLLVNDAAWLASNSLLCGYVTEGTAAEFAAAWYSPLTLLSVGLQVHSLGGGVMVMVPNEASQVQIPRRGALPSTLDAVNAALLKGDMQAAYAAGDSDARKLVGAAGLELVYEGINRLAHWRTR